MKQQNLLAFLLGTLLFWAACSPQQEEILVPNNTAPPDGTVSDVVLESYVNRSYISLMGRKPNPTEFSAGTQTLRLGNVSQDARESFLESILSSQEYHFNLFDVHRTLLIQSVDTTDINEQITLFNFLLTDSSYQAIWPDITWERDRLQLVLDIPVDLSAGSIGLVEAHRRLVDNYAYDQINMGTQNFVISMFQNFLFRYPTDAELADGELMVNDFSSQIFLESGRSKEDFIRIFFGSSDYFEGQVRDVYSRTLFREPDTEEMESLAIEYKNSGDYEDLLVQAMTSDEYVGL